MNKEEVLAIRGLTNEQREQAERYFKTMKAINKPQVIEGNVTQVKEILSQQIERYKKRKEKQREKKEKLEQAKERDNVIFEVINTARKYIEDDEIINAITNAYREKFNRNIEEQIEALREKMI